ncbi:hypothetical protein NYE24_00665 [Paenibacillus sp. FSL H7-0350]|uniref:hypothetical protein n=1 Tax=Paenibacillus sp. FSL H7-0350 TaxID=2975345 RepID=UPI003159038C
MEDIVDTDSEEVIHSKLKVIEHNIGIMKKYIAENDNIRIYFTFYNRKGEYSTIQGLLDNFRQTK